MKEEVVLITEKDEIIGTLAKLEAHQKGLLHRAISVFIYNDAGELMLQQRALHKYHSPLLWTNTCCSHPYLNESYQEAAERRLYEEMGFSTPLTEKFHFIYKAEVGNALIEHELDYVFTGVYNDAPTLNPTEVQAYTWKTHEKIITDLAQNPTKYTAWFKIIFEAYLNHLTG